MLLPFGKKARIAFAFPCLLFFSHSAFTQEAVSAKNTESDTSRIYSIDGVTVNGYRYTPELLSPMPTQVLRGKDLEKLNSFSVADALRYFSGVQLKDYGGIGGLKTVNVRSLGSAHTSVFYDGVVIGNAQNGQVDLGKFSLDNIEAIELFNGQKSCIFQPARGFFASNTLFLQGRRPAFAEGEKSKLKTAFKTGSFGLLNPSVLHELRLTKKLSLATNAEYISANGKYKYRYQKYNGYDTTAVRQNGDIESIRAELTLFRELKNNGKASVKTYYYNSERGLPGAIVANIFSHYQRLWDKNFFIQGTLQQSLFEGHELLFNGKYSRDRTRYVDPNFQTLEGALDNRYDQREAYLSLVNHYAVNTWWNVSLATDFSFNTLDANLYRFPYPNRYSYYVVLSNEVKGKRADFQLNLLGAFINEQVEQYQRGDEQQVFSPVVSLSYQPIADYEQWRIRAFYKESFRMPTFNDLYYTFVGNTFLRPEFTTQYNLGTTWILEGNGVFRNFSIQADAYYNRVKDKIVAMPSANLFRWTMMNLGEVEVKGLETNAKIGIDLSTNLQLDMGLSYTYQQAVDVTEGSTVYGDQIPYTPLHSGTLTASASYPRWQLNYSFVYTGERYSQKANIPVNYVPPWYTSDLGINWKPSTKKIQYKAGLEVNNVFNQYYDVILNFPMPGRNYRFKLTLTI